ncbi:MAG TPA: hypothetical protein PLF40_16830 [Kofleriaceae bacterium]|nr:hypothetical protein [Kofleriaceae bacterium]
MMKNLILVAALAVPAFVGCKKGAGAADCAGATASAMKMAEGSISKLPPQAQEMAKKAMGSMSGIMTKACTDGKWSSAVTDCMKAAKDEASGEACKAKLTPEQLKSMTETMAAASKQMQEDMMKAMTPPAADGSAAPAADGSAAPAADGSAAGSAAPAADGSAAPAAAAGGDMPQECKDYKAAIEKLATCDKLPQASRDAMKTGYETWEKSFANMPAEGKAAAGTACKAAADGVNQTASAMCK